MYTHTNNDLAAVVWRVIYSTQPSPFIYVNLYGWRLIVLEYYTGFFFFSFLFWDVCVQKGARQCVRGRHPGAPSQIHWIGRAIIHERKNKEWEKLYEDRCIFGISPRAFAITYTFATRGMKNVCAVTSYIDAASSNLIWSWCCEGKSIAATVHEGALPVINSNGFTKPMTVNSNKIRAPYCRINF